MTYVFAAGATTMLAELPAPTDTYARPRARVLAATAQAACERGTASLAQKDIVARAGVSSRVFRHFFESTGECLLATFDHAVAAAMTRTRAAANATDGPWAARVGAVVRTVLEYLDAEPALARFCILLAPEGPQPLRVRCGEVVARLGSTARDPRAGSGAFAWASAELAVAEVLGVIGARLLDPSAGTLAELTDELTAMIVCAPAQRDDAPSPSTDNLFGTDLR